MSVLTGALGSLAPKLLRLLRDEYKLQKGVKKQVQWLHRELESIHAFLLKVGDVPWDQLDEQVKVWAREVREESYDMEDVLDTFLVRVDGDEPADTSWLKRAMKKMGKVFSKAKARRGIAGAIEKIKERLGEVAERRQKYKPDEMILSKPSTSGSAIDPRLTAMYKEVTQLIGVDKSRDELITMLNLYQPDDDAPSKKIIQKVSIVGVGGLGKTTLAKAVYDKLKSQFDCGAFVSVGREHDLVKVFKDILFDLDQERYEDIHNTGRGVNLLIREIREFMENKRYFIVIDDVWDVRTWEAIKPSLVDNNCGSKVIITTRKADVAKAAGMDYKLRPLSSDDSMNLFYTRIFGGDRKYLDNQPNDVSYKIIKKCAGIPLAIITMASYCDLPPHLRTCLLYLSTYPEDYVIEKDSLIWKWIAEGFISGDQGTRLFELGERYFNDLVNRSLIQAVQNKWGDIASSCRVHDMVLDLMRKISSEQEFIAVFGDNVEGTPVPSNVRRLAHQKRIAEHISSEAMVTGMPKVRSYTAFMCFIDSQDQFLRFKLLRVLDIVDCDFKEGCHLEHLGDLLHLRYLGISCKDRGALALPKQIGNLKLLQTLEVYGYGTLPASIVQLTQLVRLDAQKAEVPDGIGNLTSLEDLRIRVHGIPETLRFMKELNSLQELRVIKFSTDWMDESTQRRFVESLQNLKKLQHLEVFDRFFDVDTAVWEAAGFVLPRSLCYLYLNIDFSKLPSCINPSRLPNLSHLKLKVKTMDEQDMENLARLPVLCILELTLRDVTLDACYIKVNVRDNCFQKLRSFWTNKMVRFEPANEKDAAVSMRLRSASRKLVSSGVVPNLEDFWLRVPLQALRDNISDCGNTGLEYLPSLRVLRAVIDCEGVCAEEVDAALAALRNACKVHPNNPTLETYTENEGKMVSTHDKEDEEHSQKKKKKKKKMRSS